MNNEAQCDLALAERTAKIELALAAIEKQLSERDDRLSLIEQRLEEQEYSVRRVLDMLIEWLEDDSGTPGRSHREAA